MEEENTLTLPMSRIKKIVKLDPEHISSTESANYVLGVATEMFIRQLTSDARTVTKSKGRKKVMYGDIQKVVNGVDVYSFMRDIVPKRVPIGELMNKGLIKLRPTDEEKMGRLLREGGYTDEDGVDMAGEHDEEDADVDKLSDAMDVDHAASPGQDVDTQQPQLHPKGDRELHDTENDTLEEA